MNQAAELQGSRPGAEDEAPFRETLALLEDGRVVHEMELDRIDGSREWVREVYESDSKTIHILADTFSVRLTDHPEVSGRAGLARRIPGALLAEARAAGPDALTSALQGDTTVIQWSRPAGPVLSLHVGPEALLHEVSYQAAFPGLGSTTVRWELGDYGESEAGLLPHQYRVIVGERVFIDMSVEWTTDESARLDALAATPEGFPDPVEVSGEGGPASGASVEELGNGLYRVRGLRTGFHPMFVEFQDFVAVVDAPAGYPLLLELPAGDVAPGPTPEWLSRRFRELIDETLPGKPVRHVVLTHFHNDHGGGVGAFAEPGVTVHAAPADTAAVRRFLAGSGAEGVVIEGVAAGSRITDGSRSMDVIQIGPNPHTHEMLVAYLHDPATLFVSDLVSGTTAEALAGGDLSATESFFRAWLGRVDLEPVRLLTMHSLRTVELEPM